MQDGTVEPLNSGHIGGRDLVLYKVIVPSRRLARKHCTEDVRRDKLNSQFIVACGRVSVIT